MRRIALILCLLLLPAVTSAQVVIVPAPFINGSGAARGPILLLDGSAAAPSLAFASAPTTGLFYESSATISFAAGGTRRAYINASGVNISPAALGGSSTQSGFAYTQVLNTTGVVDGVFRMAVTNTASGADSYIMALYGGASATTKLFSVDMGGSGVFGGNVIVGPSYWLGWSGASYLNGSVNGTINLFNSNNNGFTVLNIGPTTGNTDRGSQSITNGKVSIDMATATGTGTGTITTATTAIPAGSLVLGVTCRVDTILAGAGLTTWSIGDGTDADRWGAGKAIAAGTTSGGADFTITSPVYYPTATALVVTAGAGVFSTGVLTCTPHYITFTPKS